MREHGGDLEATRALDIHEKAVRLLNETLQLVLLVLVVGGGVQEVVVDRHDAGMYF